MYFESIYGAKYDKVLDILFIIFAVLFKAKG